MSIKPYDNGPWCAKCKAGLFDRPHYDYDSKADILHLTCRRCGYEWLMEVADKAVASGDQVRDDTNHALNPKVPPSEDNTERFRRTCSCGATTETGWEPKRPERMKEI